MLTNAERERAAEYVYCFREPAKFEANVYFKVGMSDEKQNDAISLAKQAFMECKYHWWMAMFIREISKRSTEATKGAPLTSTKDSEKEYTSTTTRSPSFFMGAGSYSSTSDPC